MRSTTDDYLFGQGADVLMLLASSLRAGGAERAAARRFLAAAAAAAPVGAQRSETVTALDRDDLAAPGAPHVRFTGRARAAIQTSLNGFDGRETGGALLGYLDNRGITVLDAGSPDALTPRGVDWILVEVDRAQRLERDHRAAGGEGWWLGTWHTHSIRGRGGLSESDRQAAEHYARHAPPEHAWLSLIVTPGRWTFERSVTEPQVTAHLTTLDVAGDVHHEAVASGPLQSAK